MGIRSSLPIGNLYIVAFIILAMYAGMSIYLMVSSQSNSANYRISAASILKSSEELKRTIDEERRYVIETVLYFIGSQGGVDNIQEYNSLDLDKLSNDQEAMDCIATLKEVVSSPSQELLSFCTNNRDVFSYPDSQGVWKCDFDFYAYQQCSGISQFAAKLCCDSAYYGGKKITSYRNIVTYDQKDVVGYGCHENCLFALGIDYREKCSNLDYCGALWCRDNNFYIPETYEGVPYYYKIGDSGPGYFCPTYYTFSPERRYDEGVMWEGVDPDYLINKLVDLSNKYFYQPNPSFENYLKSHFGSDLTLSFTLDFKGCTNESCRFDWVPYLDSSEKFVGRGIGGVPMVEFTTSLFSSQTVPVPIEDMIDQIRSIIVDKNISNYLGNRLQNMVFYRVEDANAPDEYSINDWNNIIGRNVFDIDCGSAPVLDGNDMTNDTFPIYDSRYCGDDPYHNNCNYNCLMEHASTSLYLASSDPLTYDRDEGYDYLLRPIFRYVKTSLGASFQPTGIGPVHLYLAPGNYNIFVRGKGQSSITLRIAGKEYSFSHSEDGEYYESISSTHQLGVCSHKKWDGNIDSYLAYGCCPIDEYDVASGTCNVDPFENDYCSSMFEGNGATEYGTSCFVDGGAVDYRDSFDLSNYIDSIEVVSVEGDIEEVDILRVNFDNTFSTTVHNGNIRGGSYEYYKDTEDCVNPLGPESISYDEFSDDEIWYTMLCLRAKGNDWPTIIDDYTYAFYRFEEIPSYSDEADKIDEFLSNYPSICLEDMGEKVLVRFNSPECEGTVVSLSSKKGNAVSGAPFTATSTPAEERLYEIKRNSSYISLPIRWNFAYRDVAEFNQELFGEDSSCSLDYEDIDGAEPFPDCSCKSCEDSKMCVFDFSSIPVSMLRNYLYDFDSIFFNTQYKARGVVE